MEISYVYLWSGEGSYKNNSFCIHLPDFSSVVGFQQYHKDCLAHIEIHRLDFVDYYI